MNSPLRTTLTSTRFSPGVRIISPRTIKKPSRYMAVALPADKKTELSKQWFSDVALPSLPCAAQRWRCSAAVGVRSRIATRIGGLDLPV